MQATYHKRDYQETSKQTDLCVFTPDTLLRIADYVLSLALIKYSNIHVYHVTQR